MTGSSGQAYPSSSQFRKLCRRAQDILSTSPACHDWDHTLRVLNNARHLAVAENADVRVVECAAVLHDIGRAEERGGSGGGRHAQKGARRARKLLPACGICDPSLVDHVVACVRTHRYRRRKESGPVSLEAQIIFDADKLDSIGAIGAGRAFHFAGRIGARVHNSEAEARDSDSYSVEDSAYREYLVKLRHIHEAMLTAEGRRMAEGRHLFMVAFFERICLETRGEDFGTG